MKKKIVILDVDDVVTPTISMVLKLYNAEHNTNIVESDIITFNFKKCPALEFNATKYFLDPKFFEILEPDIDAVEGVFALIESGCDVIFATAITRPGYNARHDWILKYFPFVPEANIIFGKRKDLLHGDWILDDKIENLLTSRCKNVVCMNRQWNNPTTHPEARDLKRVYNFKEFVGLVSKEENTVVNKLKNLRILIERSMGNKRILIEKE